MTTLSKAEIRDLVAMIDRRVQDAMAPRAPSVDELARASELREKLAAMMAEVASAPQRGKKVFDWRIPSGLAPTMNEIGGHKTRRRWVLGKIKDELTDRLIRIIEKTPGAIVHGDKTRRWIRVTRFTVQPNRIDDTASADTIGGKVPIDMLVKNGVLVDDTPGLCRREALVRKTARGNTHVLVSVFEVADEEVADDGPQDAPVEQVKLVKGAFVRAIEEAKEVA